MSALLLEGTLYFDRLAAGVATGRKKVKGIASLEIKSGSDIKDQQSKDKGVYGQVTASVAIRKPTEVKLKLQEFDKENLAWAMMGDHTTLSSGGGTVTDEAVTAKLGIFVPLAQRNLTAASVVVTNSGATTTYVEGTDYEVNYTSGHLMAISGGAITESQGLKVDYAHGAISGWKVNAETETQIKGEIYIDGINLATGERILVTVYRALLASDTGIDFFSDKFAEFSYSGRAELIAGKTTPYIVESF